jgi:5-methyltetrahydrofolate--homocysteine methyltransferase
MISGTITDASGRTLSGQTAEAFWNSVRHAEPLSIGSTARSARRRCARTSRNRAASPTRSSAPIRTPACRTPSAATTRRRPRWPACSASSRESGLVNIVGGCCGTTPEHIRAIARRSRAAPPRQRARDAAAPAAVRAWSRSTLTPTFAVRERRRAHQRHRLGEVPQADHRRRLRRGARRRARAGRNGAQVIDVNMDEGMLDSERRW